ncbi:malate dehydrogenase [Fistulina hepatica ATCC 64428]|uniref:Malate dehydrogenase n=1 Tax=Fistulina hepatica ATCC 64428 TaxID=1128425 RepID=A0A0D7A1N4_9AGAR|nr:malate dehydrogenase [Fistulina hepatica ATCC 64428]
MVKAVVLGAAGGIGQPLSLLLKSNPAVTELGLFDIVNTPGVAADLSHINTPAKVHGYLPPNDGLKKALTDADIVVIPAGVPRKPGVTECVQINAGIVKDLATGIATTCPKAFVLVISNPVNSTVPVVAEVFKKLGVYNPKRLFGVTTLDVVRASTFVAEILGDISLAPSVTVPVVGGHSGITIVPLLSQSSHALPSLKTTDYDALVTRIQFGGDEVVKAKDGTGSATLSMAHAGAAFASFVIRAVFGGESGIIAPSFVPLAADTTGGAAALRGELDQDLEFFSANVELGPEGVKRIHPLGKITVEEADLVQKAVPELASNIQKGITFVAENAPKL